MSSRQKPTHPAPNDSPVHLALRAMAREAGHEQALRDLLWSINAHDKLIAFPIVASNLRLILRAMPVQWSELGRALGLDAWQPVLDWLIENRETLCDTIGSPFTPDERVDAVNPVWRRGMARNPVYALFWCSMPDGSLADQYLRLQGQFLLAHTAAMRRCGRREDYEAYEGVREWRPLHASPYAATLAIRRLSEADIRQLVSTLPVDSAPLAFSERLKAAQVATVSPGSDDLRQDLVWADVRRLAAFLGGCWSDERRSRPNDGEPTIKQDGGESDGSEGVSDGVTRLVTVEVGENRPRWRPCVGAKFSLGERTTLHTFELGDVDDPGNDLGQTELVRLRVANYAEQRDMLDADLCPAEAEIEETQLHSDFTCGQTARDAGALAAAAKSKSRHVTLANQCLPWRYQGLATSELSHLVSGLAAEWRALSRAKVDWSSESVLCRIEMLILVEIMLWTGSPVEDACMVRYCGAPSQVDKDDVLQFVDCPDQGPQWWFPAITPEYETRVDDHPKIRPRARWLKLPDLCGSALRFRLLAKARKEGPQAAIQLFPGDPKSREQALALQLREWDPRGRLTLGRLAGFLQQRLMARYGDPVIASAVTGKVHPLAEVRLFYTSLDESFLQACYRDVVIRELAGALGPLRQPMPVATSDPPVGPEIIGSRGCPTLAAVIDCVAKFKGDLRNAGRRLATAEEFAHFHDLYTLYTLLFFAYSTGCRGIRTPYLTLDRVDPRTGLCFIADKDDRHHSKGRLLWISPALRQHMAYYRAHLAFVRRRLPHPLEIEAAPYPCFFLGALPGATSGARGYRVQRVDPIRALEPRLRPRLPVRANTQRRLLRSELIMRGAPPEVIDAFLGHWMEGEEPFGKFSTFCPMHYVQELQRWVEPFVSRILGFRPIQSPFGA